MEPEQELVHRQIGTLRLVVGAMAVGVLGLAVVAAVFGPLELQQGAAPPTKLLAIICVALMAAEAVAYVAVRGMIISRVRVEGDAPQLVGALRAFMSLSIIGAAMAEGVALFGAIVVLLGGVGLNILLVAVPFAVLLTQFPSQARWESFLERIRAAHAR